MTKTNISQVMPNAACFLDNSHIILSTYSGAKLGGTLLDPGDLVEYDPDTDTATLFLNQEEHFTSVLPNIDAVCILDSCNILLSTWETGMLPRIDLVTGDPKPLTFEEADLVQYNLCSKTAELLLDGSVKFTEYDVLTNIDAIYISEPATVFLLGLGGLVLLRR